MTPSAAREKSKSLGSGGSMVARLKLYIREVSALQPLPFCVKIVGKSDRTVVF